MNLTPADMVALPKVLLHDHLDGGLRPETLIELAGEIGYELPSSDPVELARIAVDNANSGDLVRYLEFFAHTTAVMQTEANLTRVAREAVIDNARDGVVYVELRYAPEQHQAGGLSLVQIVEAVQTGLDQGMAAAAEEGSTIRATALLCAMRQAERSGEIAQLAIEQRGRCCVGFDIAGPEFGFPAENHSAAFEALANAHVPVTVHAGEADGVQSISGALATGRARRLGHGVRVWEDIEGFGTDDAVCGPVAAHVLDEQITLECSPTSNVHTKAAQSIETHPMHELNDMGFAVTINTDNRLVSGTTMSREFELLAEAGWTKEDLFAATLTAAWSVFLPYDERAELADRIIEGYGYEMEF